MSMFNWNADAGETVVSSRFWIYWATSIPLTTVVSIALYLYLWGFRKLYKKHGDDGGPPKTQLEDMDWTASTPTPLKGFAAHLTESSLKKRTTSGFFQEKGGMATSDRRPLFSGVGRLRRPPEDDIETSAA
jgi:hypothetical protein